MRRLTSFKVAIRTTIVYHIISNFDQIRLQIVVLAALRIKNPYMLIMGKYYCVSNLDCV